MITLGFPGGTVVKNQLANAEDAGDWVSIPGLERFPKEGNPLATHSSILVWTIPWIEEPGGPQSMRSPKIGQNGAYTYAGLNSNST